MYSLKLIGSIFLMIGYAGYGGFYNNGSVSYILKILWGAVLVSGIIMVWITTKDYYNEESSKSIVILDILMVFSIFILPNIIKSIIVSHIVSLIFILILNFKYWRVRWK